MFFGPFDLKGGITAEMLTPLTTREYAMLIPLAIAALAFGIFPQPMLNFIDPYAQAFSELVLNTGRKLTLTP